jgi:hypothetical protein
MSQHTTSERCPGCGGPATVTWLGISAYGHSRPDREVAISLDCPNRCFLRPDELADSFPSTVRVAG